MSPDPDWLLEVYKLDKKSATDKFTGAYILQDNMNSLMKAGKFDFIDERLLRDMVVADISVHFIIGLLTCSNWCKDKLSHRDQFYKRVVQELTHRGHKNISVLLQGLN